MTIRHLTEYFINGKVAARATDLPDHHINDLILLGDKRYFIDEVELRITDTLFYQIYTLIWEPDMYLNAIQKYK
jgi:hypothetical protein